MIGAGIAAAEEVTLMDEAKEGPCVFESDPEESCDRIGGEGEDSNLPIQISPYNVLCRTSP